MIIVGSKVTFKDNWEKSNQLHFIKDSAIKAMVKLAYPKDQLISYELINGGCANLNIKIILDGNKFFLLRIYLRDKAAACREKKLGELLKDSIPLPITCFIGEYKEYCFAITSFIEGITLRDLLLGNIPHDIDDIMYKVGQLLAKIQTYKFNHAGFFDKDLNITQKLSPKDYMKFGNSALKYPIVQEELSEELIEKIQFYLREDYEKFFPDNLETCLVHGDFDPSNILVKNIDDSWAIAAILDWEFAMSGGKYSDMANMLRYSHKMPASFKESFIRGLKSSGIIFSDNWHINIYMLNIISLLGIFIRSDSKSQPKQCADIIELLKYIIQKLDEFENEQAN